MTPAELATTTVKRYARYTHPARWGYVGDRIFELYEYLTARIPGARGSARGRITRDAPRPYKQRALELTAELVTLAYRFPYLPALHWHPITWRDVKSRIAKRRPPR
jgi:hypothetical protein